MNFAHKQTAQAQHTASVGVNKSIARHPRHLHVADGINADRPAFACRCIGLSIDNHHWLRGIKFAALDGPLSRAVKSSTSATPYECSPSLRPYFDPAGKYGLMLRAINLSTSRSGKNRSTIASERASFPMV